MAASPGSEGYKLEVVKNALKTLRLESRKREFVLEEQLTTLTGRFEREKKELNATIRRLQAELREARGESPVVVTEKENPEKRDGLWIPEDDEAAMSTMDDKSAAALRFKLQAREATITSLRQERDDMRATLTQRESTINALQQEKATLTARLEEHGRQQGNANAKIMKLRRRLDAMAVSEALTAQGQNRGQGTSWGVSPGTADALRELKREWEEPLVQGYADFVSKLNEKACAPLKQTVESFITVFQQRPKDSYHEVLQDFLNHMETPVRQNRMWKGCDSDEISEAMTCLETYILDRRPVFNRIFASLDQERARDAALAEKLRVLQFVKPSHLDIHSVFRFHPAFTLARKEIARLNDVMSPAGKVQIVYRTARLIQHVLLDSPGEDDATHADNFLPLMIYTILQAQPLSLNFNVEYVSRFRHPERLNGEAAYYFTQFSSAVFFLENLTASSLSLDPAEFTRRAQSRQRRRHSDPGVVGENTEMPQVAPSALLIDPEWPSPERNHSY